MAEEDVDDDDEVEDGEEEMSEPSSGGKKKLLIIIVIVILLLVGGLAGAYFTGLLDPVISLITGSETEQVEDEGSSGPSVFYELPALTVNLNTAGRKARFIKIQVSLELANEQDKPRVEAVIARVMDNFNVYLRELRIEDLSGSAGMQRLREELLLRVNSAVRPGTVKDVLFKEMLVQ